MPNRTSLKLYKLNKYCFIICSLFIDKQQPFTEYIKHYNNSINLKYMFVSGMTIESKKYNNSRKLDLTKQEDIRPISSELPEIEPRCHTIGKPNPSGPPKSRNGSHHKIYMTKKIKQKNEEHVDRAEYTSENRIEIKNIKKKESATNIAKRTKKLDLNNKSEDQTFIVQNQDALLAYYRYYPVAVIAGCGFRDDLMKTLNQKADFQPYAPHGKKMTRKGLQQLWTKLTKLAQLKGKYKYREKFNLSYSAQLKSFNYKRKELKRKADSQSSSSDDDIEKTQKCRDMQTWKKSMGVSGSKVFIVKGNYKDFRNALIERGWVQNTDKNSLFYDLKWTTKVKDIKFETVKQAQLVNHFNNNACLTSKYGLCKSLRSIMVTQALDIDRFFPKAYDMSDLQDFENFLEVYKWIYCESILKLAIQTTQDPTLEQQLKIKLAYIVTSRRLLRAEKLMVNIVNSKYNLCTFNEWRFLTTPKQCKLEVIQETFREWQIDELNWTTLKQKVESLINKLFEREPQFSLNGSNNIWIVKPAFLSRGRGIKCISELNSILDYAINKETQFVVQKYIQNPLIINRRKFDIRQWVLIEDYAPPKIWVYSEFYLRFCLEQYDTTKLNNKFAHLTNNSIQKYNSKVNAEQLMNQSMWSHQQFMQYVQSTFGEGKFKQIIARMREVVVATIISTQDQVVGRHNSFQLIGYDFMIDQQLNPWLIEINSSPSMDYSTPVTRRLVKMVLQDTVKVIVDLKRKKSKKKTAGLFKCIYDGQGSFDFKRYCMTEQSQQ